MVKRAVSPAQELPYAELVIRPADTRPIVVSIDELGGNVEFSRGTQQDAVLTYVVLHLMAAAARSLGIVRQMKEDHQAEHELRRLEDDDIPF